MPVKRRRRQDLRLQLLALYLLFVVPIFVVGVLMYTSASARLRADVSAADLSLARAIALETDDMLLKARDAVAEFAQMPAVVAASPRGMERAFSAGAAARQDVNLFYRLSPEGIMLYHYPSGPGSTVGKDFSFRDYFVTARDTGRHVFSKGRISPTTGRPVVTSVMPVEKAGGFAGVVAANLELQKLTETVRRISLDRANGEAVMIIDSAGQLIAHSHSDELLQNIVDTVPGVHTVLSGGEGSFTATDSAGVEYLYSYTPVPSAGWGVIVQRPTRQAFASLDSFQRGLVLALAIFGLGAIFFWVVLSNRLINPLEKLTRFGLTVSEDPDEFETGRRSVQSIAHRADQMGELTRVLLRAEEDIRRRILELTTLNKTSRAVVSTLDTETVISNILDEVQRLLGVRQCALMVVNEEMQKLELRASRGMSADHRFELDLADTDQDIPVFKAIHTNQPVQVPDINAVDGPLPVLSLARPEGCRSALIVPLAAPHISPAVLVIYRADVHQFSTQEIDLATSFANHAAVALEHATLFSLTDAELQKQVRSLSALNRVGHSVSQSLEVGDVLNNAMDAVFEIMPADACWIYLQRETEDFLRLRAQRGLPAELTEQLRDQLIEYGQGVAGRVATTGEPMLLDLLTLQPTYWPDDPMIAAANWQSFATVPLLAKDEIIGVLGMAAKTGPAFSEADVSLLQALGDQIAIAVVNARLYRRSGEIATLEERNRMAREIHDTLAQGFTGILVQLRAAERLSLKRPEQAVQSLQEAQELARQSLQEARRSVLNLRPTVLENTALDQAIARQVARFQAESGVAAEFALEGYPSPLSPEFEKYLYRITQEALTNVARHAQARRVQVTLLYEHDAVQLTISDDGIGLNGRVGNGSPAELRRLADGSNGHFGLLGIHERVSLMGGQVLFDSPPSGGTTIKVRIPV
ncbi:MAG: GAF domain-containing protein [Chloroflexi bacterium]|nr:MAG: GAF domain-containing protein [Chloroflexota bacterium]